MDSGFIPTLLSAALLPPLSLILLCIAGLIVQWKHPRTGFALCTAGLTLLAVFSTAVGTLLVVRPLENMTAALDQAKVPSAQAIVVLGGIDTAELARARSAARLHRQTGLPVLATGKCSHIGQILKEEYLLPLKWSEDEARNTAENAENSYRILRKEGVERILLVTDAIHMPRSTAAFANAGFKVIPAPIKFYSHEAIYPKHFIPNAENLEVVNYALREWLGMAWYRIRYGIAD